MYLKNTVLVLHFICYCWIESKAAQLEAAEVQKTKLERENLHLAQEMEKYSEIQVIDL